MKQLLLGLIITSSFVISVANADDTLPKADDTAVAEVKTETVNTEDTSTVKTEKSKVTPRSALLSSLSEEQKEQIKKIHTNNSKKLMETLKSLGEERDNAIRDILNDEQKAVFDSMKADHDKHMEDFRKKLEKPHTILELADQLDEPRKAQTEEIFKEYNEKNNAAFTEHQEYMKKFSEKMLSLAKEKDDKIRAILNDDEKAEFDRIKAENKAIREKIKEKFKENNKHHHHGFPCRTHFGNDCGFVPLDFSEDTIENKED